MHHPTISPPLFDGTVALVSGASQGIGRAIALRLLDAGCRVAITDVQLDNAREAMAGLDAASAARCRAFALDVRDAAQCAAVVAELAADWGPVGVLVNNAGVGGRSQSTDPAALAEDLDRVMAVNVKGVLQLTMACADGLKATRGAVVNVASITSLVATRAHLVYGASKGAVAQLTKFLARDFGPHGVRVNAVAPGLVMTPMTAQVAADRERFSTMVARTFLKRAAEPDDIAGPVVFLASEQARYITGTVVPVDGGYTAN
ncbi:NAD(P)-dependent dehydrogenase (short-subunit alcohol dehydrogenase family) [Variovorax sp. TBS-050B]|uniref:SDR family NAD(P)-dependent oxidoreductase n=1 Tax=Variovorax sp. TBS-050B TaxID=2940551 RepID=UPI002475942D|nr:SDR family oxidoreductase [Variovorax sp. TBS-050B]MDH6590234.1 NAD(P)-dependent dehydrogenase (short-subunit alcohol dehydrogenase family) [Variovorax sp. TBS-050B]